jgi:chromate transporter
MVNHALVGLGAAASGLIVATAARMAEPLLRSRPWLAAPFILAAFASVAVLHFPLPYVLIALGPLSIAIAWWWKRHRA